MSKKTDKLTPEEKKIRYDAAMAKLQEKHDKKIVKLAEKKARLTAKLKEKYAEDPEKLELELGILTIDNDVWIDMADAELAEKAKTLELLYLK